MADQTQAEGIAAKAAPKSTVVPALERSARLIALLESSPNKAFSLTAITRRLAIPKSTALNICSEHVAAQFLRRSQSGHQLVRRLVQLGPAYVSSGVRCRDFCEAGLQYALDLRATHH